MAATANNNHGVQLTGGMFSLFEMAVAFMEMRAVTEHSSAIHFATLVFLVGDFLASLPGGDRIAHDLLASAHQNGFLPRTLTYRGNERSLTPHELKRAVEAFPAPLLPTIAQQWIEAKSLSSLLAFPNPPRQRIAPSMIHRLRAREQGRPGAVTLEASMRRFEPIGQVVGHTFEVLCMTFDRTQKRFITGSNDWTIKIWCAETGWLLHCLRGHLGDVQCLAVNRENTMIASGACDGTIRVWNLQTGQPMVILRTPLVGTHPLNRQVKMNNVTALLWSASAVDETRLLIAATRDDGMVRVWLWRRGGAGGAPATFADPDRPLTVRVQTTASDYPVCLSTDPAGLRLAVGGSDGVLRVFTTRPLIEHRLAAGPAGADVVMGEASAAPSPHGGPALPAQPPVPAAQEVPPPLPLPAPDAPPAPAQEPPGLIISPAGELPTEPVPFVPSPTPDPQNGPNFVLRPVAHLRHQGSLVDVQFSNKGDRLLAASDDGKATIWTWDASFAQWKAIELDNAPIVPDADEQPPPPPPPPAAAEGAAPQRRRRRRKIKPNVLLFCWLNRDDFVVTANADGYLRVFESATGDLVQVMRGDGVAPSTHDEPREILTLEPHPQVPTVFLTATYEQGYVALWNRHRAAPLWSRQFRHSYVGDAKFSPDGWTFLVSEYTRDGGDADGVQVTHAYAVGRDRWAAPREQFFASDFEALNATALVPTLVQHAHPYHEEHAQYIRPRNQDAYEVQPPLASRTAIPAGLSPADLRESDAVVMHLLADLLRVPSMDEPSTLMTATEFQVHAKAVARRPKSSAARHAAPPQPADVYYIPDDFNFPAIEPDDSDDEDYQNDHAARATPARRGGRRRGPRTRRAARDANNNGEEDEDPMDVDADAAESLNESDDDEEEAEFDSHDDDDDAEDEDDLPNAGNSSGAEPDANGPRRTRSGHGRPARGTSGRTRTRRGSATADEGAGSDRSAPEAAAAASSSSTANQRRNRGAPRRGRAASPEPVQLSQSGRPMRRTRRPSHYNFGDAPSPIPGRDDDDDADGYRAPANRGSREPRSGERTSARNRQGMQRLREAARRPPSPPRPVVPEENDDGGRDGGEAELPTANRRRRVRRRQIVQEEEDDADVRDHADAVPPSPRPEPLDSVPPSDEEMAQTHSESEGEMGAMGAEPFGGHGADLAGADGASVLSPSEGMSLAECLGRLYPLPLPEHQDEVTDIMSVPVPTGMSPDAVYPSWMLQLRPTVQGYYPQVDDRVHFFPQGYMSNFLRAARDQFDSKQKNPYRNPPMAWTEFAPHEEFLACVVVDVAVKPYSVSRPKRTGYTIVLHLQVVGRGGEMFELHYEELDNVPDFLVLSARVEQALAVDLALADAAIYLDVDEPWACTVTDVHDDVLWERYRVQWSGGDNGDVPPTACSPWELLSPGMPDTTVPHIANRVAQEFLHLLDTVAVDEHTSPAARVPGQDRPMSPSMLRARLLTRFYRSLTELARDVARLRAAGNLPPALATGLDDVCAEWVGPPPPPLMVRIPILRAMSSPATPTPALHPPAAAAARHANDGYESGWGADGDTPPAGLASASASPATAPTASHHQRVRRVHAFFTESPDAPDPLAPPVANGSTTPRTPTPRSSSSSSSSAAQSDTLYSNNGRPLRATRIGASASASFPAAARTAITPSASSRTRPTRQAKVGAQAAMSALAVDDGPERRTRRTAATAGTARRRASEVGDDGEEVVLPSRTSVRSTRAAARSQVHDDVEEEEDDVTPPPPPSVRTRMRRARAAAARSHVREHDEDEDEDEMPPLPARTRMRQPPRANAVQWEVRSDDDEGEDEDEVLRSTRTTTRAPPPRPAATRSPVRDDDEDDEMPPPPPPLPTRTSVRSSRAAATRSHLRDDNNDDEGHNDDDAPMRRSVAPRSTRSATRTRPHTANGGVSEPASRPRRAAAETASNRVRAAWDDGNLDDALEEEDEADDRVRSRAPRAAPARSSKRKRSPWSDESDDASDEVEDVDVDVDVDDDDDGSADPEYEGGASSSTAAAARRDTRQQKRPRR
ncbi:hypothetical protein AMAG_11727 [Allomyces macrogynus ATCC 38327]|uniref:BRWD/PHIP ancillary-like domain-containing protein n=1 Tax=Allomyces macrogynus (strain ATCC 38327) TaxID=578462 RepID=A0A0L0SW93_ALLM3|nr:hypothetical protein AMAG_11727 [Allomyces macrogynus ATCC 38327]|eukprot:KNE66609.1 hypothetical protein AMAG_11727 [Allomyces macrogynus ATCC 38327]